MKDKSCFYCEKNEVLDSLMIHIYELNGSDLYLNLNQSHLGRVIVTSKVHVKEIFHLSSAPFLDGKCLLTISNYASKSNR